MLACIDAGHYGQWFYPEKPGPQQEWWTFPSLTDDSELFYEHWRILMNNRRYTPEFKDEAIRQVIEWGYSVTEISQRLGVARYHRYWP